MNFDVFVADIEVDEWFVERSYLTKRQETGIKVVDTLQTLWSEITLDRVEETELALLRFLVYKRN